MSEIREDPGEREPSRGHDHEHAHQHHHHGSRSRLGEWVRHLIRPHSHEAADKVDAALEASAEGMRALWVSLGALAATAVAQAVVVAVSGSVALLGDTIQRHEDCRTQQPLSRTESDSPGPHGAWLVRYEIDGEQLTDYWFYADRRWVFDLVLSNPDMVPLYRMSPPRYVAAVGCNH